MAEEAVAQHAEPLTHNVPHGEGILVAVSSAHDGELEQQGAAGIVLGDREGTQAAILVAPTPDGTAWGLRRLEEIAGRAGG